MKLRKIQKKINKAIKKINSSTNDNLQFRINKLEAIKNAYWTKVEIKNFIKGKK